MSEPSAEELARRWIAEFGSQAAWHARARIEKLAAHGDDDGAALWTRVLAVIEAQAPRNLPFARRLFRRDPAR